MRSLRTRAIPERLRGVFTTRRYTNPRLPTYLPTLATTMTQNQIDESNSIVVCIVICSERSAKHGVVVQRRRRISVVVAAQSAATS